MLVAYGPTASELALRLVRARPGDAASVLRIVSTTTATAGDAATEPVIGELKVDAEGFVDSAELRTMIARVVNDGRESLVIECDSGTDVGALVADLEQSEHTPGLDGAAVKARVACMSTQILLDAFVRSASGPESLPPAAIAEQVEFATVVAVLDATGAPDDAVVAEAIVRGLNPAADVALVRPADRSLGVSRSAATLVAPDHEPTRRRAPASPVTAISFGARRPFHPQRFWAFLKSGLAGVFRGKGFFWVATQMDLVGGLNIAGTHKQAAPVGTWWAAMPESRSNPAEWPEPIRSEWVAPYGDRRQALSFLGLEIDGEALRRGLESCLLTDIEMAAGEQSWREFEDPFAAWSGAGHDHAHHSDCGCNHEHHHDSGECRDGSCCDHHHHHEH